jgi:hypothetical protein
LLWIERLFPPSLIDLDASGAVVLGPPELRVLFLAGLISHAPATIASAKSPSMTASQMLAGASAPAPAQLNDDSASARVAISEEV